MKPGGGAVPYLAQGPICTTWEKQNQTTVCGILHCNPSTEKGQTRGWRIKVSYVENEFQGSLECTVNLTMTIGGRKEG